MSQLRVEDGQLVYTMMVYATEGDRACLARMGEICAVPDVNMIYSVTGLLLLASLLSWLSTDSLMPYAERWPRAITQPG